ncbi:hypothetical protein BBJ28_00009304 [Nothophytophthora sp. Chile5]|nr:hypothetical protein BBJ28_00009304 [Nothophytophthora sp. Chile5]
MSEPLGKQESAPGKLSGDASPSLALAGAMEKAASDFINPSTAYGTYNPYQRIDVRSSEPAELSGSSASSIRKFSCQFDPGTKSGRVLVLVFDRKGWPTLKEMSRHEVLRMTQEAASHDEEAPAEGSTKSKHALLLEIRKTSHVCLVYVPDGADTLLSILKTKFSEHTRDDTEAPYEFRALEALLATLSRYFQVQYDQLSPVVVSALDHLMRGSLNSRELERLREFKNTMNEFESQVDGVRRILMELLDNEVDLRLLYLTKLHQDPSLLQDLWSFDSEEAEVLIENYLQDIFSTRTKADLMQHRITNTESLVMLKLDSMRNYLLGVDLIFSIVVISISVGTLIAGVFGMNLHSGLEEADSWFSGVVFVTVVLIIALTTTGVLFFKQKGVLLQ